MIPYLKGDVAESPRDSFVYFSDDGEVIAVRMGDWKCTLMEQRAKTCQLWQEPFVKLRLPYLHNLRRDPFERAHDQSNSYWDWFLTRAYCIYAMQDVIGSHIENFEKFPPRQKPASFNLDDVMKQLAEAGDGAQH
jgi:arylsulfatase